MQLTKKYYQTADKREPAKEFISGLEKLPRLKIFSQIDRAKLGNFGKGHGVGGISELVIDYGPGYRVYYSIVENNLVILLLTAGTKKTQAQDIKLAREYLKDFELRRRGLR